MKLNKKLLVVTTILTLLPVVIGLILWEQLPAEMATHFGGENEPNGWSSKAFTVFGIPAIMAVLHLFCLLVTAADPKKNNISPKAMNIVYWIIPVVSIFMMGAVYAFALGIEVNIGMLCCLLIGVLLIVLGNYMPKAKQNYTFGVKTPWALNSEENWNKSNRLAAWVFVALGFIFIINAFLLWEWLVLIVIPGALIPIVYSYILYKKGI